MQRSRLKNIINKSKEISNKSKVVGDPFDEFKKSLPKELEIDDNYRLEAAWKAYGSPKDYKHALWEGLIQPIDEETYKFPSIGYNEDTDEYEYLNKGEDNETVAKDIRVWDNDVIPFVKELKHGGYIRKFNKEKDCWTYTKNSQKEDTLDQKQINIQKEQSGELINSFQKGGKPKLDSKETGEDPIGYLNDGTPLYKKGDGTIGPLTKENIGKDNLFDLIKPIQMVLLVILNQLGLKMKLEQQYIQKYRKLMDNLLIYLEIQKKHGNQQQNIKIMFIFHQTMLLIGLLKIIKTIIKDLIKLHKLLNKVDK